MSTQKKLTTFFIVWFTLIIGINLSSAQCPKSYAWVGGRLSGYFEKVVFRIQDKIQADRFCEGVSKETLITSFSAIVIRNEKIIFKTHNLGAIFQRKTRNYFKGIILGDVVRFYNIQGTDFDGKKVVLDPLEYHIIDF